MGPVGLDVPEEALDPGLVGGGAGAAEALGDGKGGEELAGGVTDHGAAVVAHGQQQRVVPVVVGAGHQAFGVEGVGKDQLDLGGGLFGRDRAASHLRDTTSAMANVHRWAPGKWVASRHQTPVRFPLQPVGQVGRVRVGGVGRTRW